MQRAHDVWEAPLSFALREHVLGLLSINAEVVRLELDKLTMSLKFVVRDFVELVTVAIEHAPCRSWCILRPGLWRLWNGERCPVELHWAELRHDARTGAVGLAESRPRMPMIAPSVDACRAK